MTTVSCFVLLWWWSRYSWHSLGSRGESQDSLSFHLVLVQHHHKFDLRIKSKTDIRYNMDLLDDQSKNLHAVNSGILCMTLVWNSYILFSNMPLRQHFCSTTKHPLPLPIGSLRPEHKNLSSQTLNIYICVWVCWHMQMYGKFSSVLHFTCLISHCVILWAA